MYPEASQSNTRRRIPLWPFAVLASLVAVGIASVWAWNVSLPYYAVSPGPVKQVESLIEIDAPDTTVFDPDGDLYFLTVQLQEVNVYEYLEARVDPRIDVVARETVRPEGVSEDQLREINFDLMEESKKIATCVALQHVGFPARCEGTGARVMGFVEGTAADEVLRQGDVLVAIDGDPVKFNTDAVAIVGQRQVGDQITLTVLREGEEVDLPVTLVENVSEPGRPMVGIYLESLGLSFDFPFRVVIDSHNIGGPSAGMMYTLAIIDRLTEGPLTAGQPVAGTGTIRVDGTVGAVGGVRQKVFAARANGARYVLVPRGNYEEALSAAAGEVEVVPIDHVDEALAFFETLPAS